MGLSYKKSRVVARHRSASQQSIFDWGSNVQAARYFHNQWMFVDAFQTSQPWRIDNLPEENGGQRVFTNQYGFPSSANTLPCITTFHNGWDDIPGGNDGIPQGTWKFDWTGEGNVTVISNGSQTFSHSGPDETTVHDLSAPLSNGVRITVDSAGATDSLRDFHVWYPDFRPGESRNPFGLLPDGGSVRFHPLMIERLAKFYPEGPLRYMFFSQVNNVKPIELGGFFSPGLWSAHDWNHRVTPAGAARYNSGVSTDTDVDMATQGSLQGTCLEYQCELANAVYAAGGTDMCWICLPRGASQGWFEGSAEVCYNTLHPDIKVIIEYGNEEWTQGTPPPPQEKWLAYIRDTYGFANYPQALGYEAGRMYDNFRNKWIELGGDPDRVIRFLGTSLGFTDWWLSQAMIRMNEFWPDQQPDAAGGTCYVQVANVDQTHDNTAPYAGGIIWDYYMQWDGNDWNNGANGEIFDLKTSDLTYLHQYLIGQGPFLGQGRVQDVANRVGTIGEWCYTNGALHMLYEAGPHLVTSFGNIDLPMQRDVYNAYQRDPYVKELYALITSQILLNPDMNIDYVCHYDNFGSINGAPNAGTFGVLHEQDEDILVETPYNIKQRAILQGRNVGAALDNL